MESSNTLAIMGVVNITPDSFSDGGCYYDPEKALQHAATLVEQGSDIIDLGAESSRPGAKPVDLEAEWQRLAPAIKLIRQQLEGIRMSVDTTKPEIMQRACEEGVDMINDISGCQSTEILKTLKAKNPKLQYLAMHMHGKPQTMQESPSDDLETIRTFYKDTQQQLESAGFDRHDIWLDPGIGFGKTDDLNWRALQSINSARREYNIAIGISRKSFLGRWLGIDDPAQRDDVTKGLEAGLLLSGVGLIRTHTVAPLHRLRQHLGIARG